MVKVLLSELEVSNTYFLEVITITKKMSYRAFQIQSLQSQMQKKTVIILKGIVTKNCYDRNPL
jgi:hypothetical protein